MRRIRLLGATVMLGCCLPWSRATQPTPDTPLPLCMADGLRRWQLPASGERTLRVWIDPRSQDFDGWGPYGRRRLRLALEEWNSIRLPVRFALAETARESDIIVDVIRVIPAADDSSGRDQAALTHLTFHQNGLVSRARILIAVTDPLGRRYALADQQANLLHELGHAMGLPHARETSAVMAVRRTGYELTGADIALARAHYPRCRAPGT